MRIAPSVAARWKNDTLASYDYRRRDHLLVLRNVPAGVCKQCGEKYFTPDVLRRMDQSFHNIFERAQKPDQVLDVPAVNF
jgi:YgiT-type zinc finger domain-containing protein